MFKLREGGQSRENLFSEAAVAKKQGLKTDSERIQLVRNPGGCCQDVTKIDEKKRQVGRTNWLIGDYCLTDRVQSASRYFG